MRWNLSACRRAWSARSNTPSRLSWLRNCCSRAPTWAGVRALRTPPSAWSSACRGAAATTVSGRSPGRRERMLLKSAESSCSGQRSLRLSTTCKGLPLLSNVCRASRSVRVRSLSTTSRTKSAPMATRDANRALPAALISSIPGVSTSSTRLRSAIETGHTTPCWCRVLPWATSVASRGSPIRALIRLDLPTPTRPNTAIRKVCCCSRCNCRSSWTSSPPRSPCSRLESRRLRRH